MKPLTRPDNVMDGHYAAAHAGGVKCMNCVACGSEFSFLSSLKKAKYSWPKLRAFGYECADCNTSNHIRISDGRYQQIQIIGAPGPEWEVLNTNQDRNLSYRQDDNYFHVWLNDKHYEIKEKT